MAWLELSIHIAMLCRTESLPDVNCESCPVAALAAFFTASMMDCVELLDVSLKGVSLEFRLKDGK